MLNTTKKLINGEKITQILLELIQQSYKEAKEEKLLLCMECSDIDLEIALSNHFELEEAIKENFSLDEFGDVIENEEYRNLMYELHEYFVDLHISSGLFDFFPEGEYEVQNEKLYSDSDVLAPKGIFYAPFEQAQNN